MTDSTNLSNDRSGYSCYTFVFPASPDITAKVTAIERASRMTRAKIPAHITVKGTFHQIADLEHIKAVARRVIGSTKRFWISFEGAEVDCDAWGAGLHVGTTPEMQRLHDDLAAAFKPLATTVYNDDPYGAHMTLYQEAPADGMKPLRPLIDETDFGPGFEAYAIDLMGRRGPAYGGRWELIERFPLAGA
jgi:2'-5' RNA ligase